MTGDSSGIFLETTLDWSSSSSNHYTDKIYSRNFRRLLQSTLSETSDLGISEDKSITKSHNSGYSNIGKRRIERLKERIYNEESTFGSFKGDDGCCTIINDRHGKFLGWLPFSLMTGTQIWLCLIPCLMVYNAIASVYTFEEDPWSTIFNVLIMIITIAFTIYGAKVLANKSPDGLTKFAALQCIVMNLTLGASIRRILLNIHYFFIPDYPYMTQAIYVVVKDSLIILLLLVLLVPTLSTFRSLSCVWEVGGLGTEYQNWETIVDKLAIWDY